MKLSNITREDGTRAAQLAGFLRSGKWQMSGEEIANYTKVVQWFHSLCMDIATQLPSEGKQAAAPTPAPKLVVADDAPKKAAKSRSRK